MHDITLQSTKRLSLNESSNKQQMTQMYNYIV